MKEYMSVGTQKQLIIFSNFQKSDNILFLYEPKLKAFQTFQSFIKAGIENNETCIYAFDKKTKKIPLENSFNNSIDAKNLYIFPVEENGNKNGNNGDQIQLKDLPNKLNKIWGNGNGGNNAFRCLIDYGSLTNRIDVNAIKTCEAEIIKKRDTNSSTLTTISAFDISSLDCDIINNLIELNKKIIISVENDTMVSWPSFSNTNGKITKDRKQSQSIDIISQKIIDSTVKKSLDVIVLSLLNQEPLCGYDIIKTIFRQFDVLLSQGAVYPLLYDLKEKGLLEITKISGTRSKAYEPTEKGKKYIRNKLTEYIKAQSYILDLVSNSPPVSKSIDRYEQVKKSHIIKSTKKWEKRSVKWGINKE